MNREMTQCQNVKNDICMSSINVNPNKENKYIYLFIISIWQTKSVFAVQPKTLHHANMQSMLLVD